MKRIGLVSKIQESLSGLGGDSQRKTEFYTPIPLPPEEKPALSIKEWFSRLLQGQSSRHWTHNLLFGALGVIAAVIIILLVGYAIEQISREPSSQAHASETSEIKPNLANSSTEVENQQGNRQPIEQSKSQPVDGGQPAKVPIQPTNVPENELIVETSPTVQSLHTPTPIPRTDDAFVIENVPSTKQDRSLNCEFVSAADLARYYGVTISWQAIFLAVGFDPNGNPHVGFVGKSVDDTPRQLYPNGYGVYAEPIAKGMTKLGIEAKSFHTMGIEWLKKEIRAKRPVIVWAPFDMEEVEPAGWYTADGKTWIKAIRGEHTFTVFGYNDDGVYVNDPWYGRERFFTWNAFNRAWSYLDQMAVSIQPETQ